MSSYFEQCTEDQLKKIYGEFGATSETIRRDVKTLMEWLETQPHLPNTKDEYMLRLFLVRCKNSLERTKQMLELYYIYKAQFPELFANRDPSTAEFKKSVNFAQHFNMPKLTPELNRVIVSRTFKVPSNEMPDVNEFMRSMVTAVTLNCFMPGIYKKVTIIIDFKNLNASQMPVLLSTFHRIFQLIIEHVPTRIEKIYILNSSPLVDSLLVLGRKLSKKVFQERLVIWKKDEKDLVEAIPKECLPNEYGGTAGSYDQLRESFYKEMVSWKGWLEEENKCVADLSKLSEDRKRTLDMGNFGVEGTFRKLNLD